MNEKIQYEWDGEKIRQKVQVEDEKISPKQMIDNIDRLNGEINKAETDLKKYEDVVEQIKRQIPKLKETLSKWTPFEEKCMELQKEKLIGLYKLHKDELIKEAKEMTEKQKSETTDEKTIKLMNKQNFDRVLATNKKVAEKLSRRAITKFIYTEPIIDNPFKD